MNDDLIKVLGIDNLSKEEQNTITEDFNKKLFKNVFQKSLSEISEEKREYCLNILNSNEAEESDYDEVENVFINEINDYDNFIKTTVEEFIKEYVRLAREEKSVK